MNKIPYVYGLIVFILLAHWTAVYLTLDNPSPGTANFANWFDLDREYNVPTATNSLLLGLSALTAIVLATRVKFHIQRLGWVLFAVLFGYLALDEILIIHEQMAEPLRKLLHITGSNPLYHAWVVPAIGVIAAMVLAVLVLRKYYKQLRVFSDVLILVAMMAGGVVGAEIIGTYVYPHTAAYRLFMVPIEEIFELFMATQILRKLLTQLAEGKR